MIEGISRLKIGQKLVLCFLALGVLPALIIGLFSLKEASNGLESLAFNQLEAVREIKKTQLEDYFSDRQSDMRALVEVGGTLRQQALEKLVAIREAKQRSVEGYFKGVELQAQTLSGNKIVKDFAVELHEGLELYRTRSEASSADLDRYRSTLNEHYTDRVATIYESINDGKPLEGADQIVGELDDVAAALQHYYFLGGGAEGAEAALRTGGPFDYAEIHDQVHGTMQSFQRKFGFDNIHLVDALSGRVSYSVDKKLAFGTSLLNGPYADTHLAGVFQQARQAESEDSVFLSDFATYAPSYGAPALFVATPVFRDDQVIAVLMVQLNINSLNLMMAQRSGLGNSGEIYLVGEDHLMRSDSNFEPSLSAEESLKNPATGTASSTAVEAALAGEEGAGVVSSYLGKPVLSSWSPVKVGNHTWALVADVDVTEALSPIDENWQPFYQKYTEIYGYEDLLLINPDGFVFYTSANGEESRTNLLEGTFSDTHLSKLVRRTVESKSFGFADFKPYAASNNEPAAFIAQPLVHNDTVEMVIALRLPLSGINRIMGIRDGMGESGESYLVGPDNLMRSDSFSDVEGRSVDASFAGNVAENGVKTAGVQAALAGQAEAQIISNYQGQEVLSAYTPINFGGVTWALLAEVDKSEAFAARDKLMLLTIAVLLISVALIVVVGVLLARRISRPLVEASRIAGLVSSGDLTPDIKVTRRDEIGDLQQALKAMTAGLRTMVSQISSSADQQASAAEQLSTITEQTRGHVREQNASTELVATAITQMSATVQEVSKNTNDAAEAAKQAIGDVTRGNDEVRSVISEIHSFAAEVERMAGILKSVEAGAENIGGIVDVINGIADQTNLLALNAAIEAARAGDQGRGFAVVADEVRSLAQSTQDSTKQIEDMIRKLQQDARASAQAMTSGREQMEQVVKQAETTGEALSRINDSVDHITDMNLQIASAAEEQSAVAEDINMNVNQISELSHRTDADAEQIASASDELSKLAADLQQQTRRFKM